MSMLHVTKSHKISQSIKTFPFKRLPREIRDQIYDHVFGPGESAIAVCHTIRRMPIPTYLNSAPLRDPSVRLALFLVDCQISQESIKSFYSRRNFCLYLSTGDKYSNQVLSGIGKQCLDLIRTIRYSVALFSDVFGSGKDIWRETFQHLRSACGLRTLEIDLGMTDMTRHRLTPREWAELELCLVGIKGRVDLLVYNTCRVLGWHNPVDRENMIILQSNCWTCKKGETEWSTKKRVYRAELY